MRWRQSKLLGKVLRSRYLLPVPLFCMFVTGLVLRMIARDMPLFSDARLAERLRSLSADQMCGDQSWYARMDAIRTNKALFEDLGGALILAPITVWVGLGLLGITALIDLKQVKTPRRKWLFLVGLPLSIVWIFYSSFLGLDAQYLREHFQSCSDSMMIPAGGIVLFGFFVTLFTTLLTICMTTLFAPLPVTLWAWDTEKRTACILTTAIFTSLILWMSWSIFATAISPAYMAIPGMVFAIYLLAAMRAALCAPQPSRPDILRPPLPT